MRPEKKNHGWCLDCLVIWMEFICEIKLIFFTLIDILEKKQASSLNKSP